MEPRIFRAAEAAPYVTKDESLIVEIFHPATVPGVPYSVAEATVPPGGRTVPHRHEHSLETYYVLEGEGVLLVGGGRTTLARGDGALLPPGTRHAVEAGPGGMRFLCLCFPPYDHDQTILEEDDATGR